MLEIMLDGAHWQAIQAHVHQRTKKPHGRHPPDRPLVSPGACRIQLELSAAALNGKTGEHGRGGCMYATWLCSLQHPHAADGQDTLRLLFSNAFACCSPMVCARRPFHGTVSGCRLRAPSMPRLEDNGCCYSCQGVDLPSHMQTNAPPFSATDS